MKILFARLPSPLLLAVLAVPAALALLAAPSVPAALAQEVAQDPEPGPAAAPFRFELHWKGPAALAVVGRDGCSFGNVSFKCAAPPCTVVIAPGGVTKGDEPAKPGASFQLKLTGDGPPVMTCLVGECSWAIEHADGSVHSSGLKKNGSRRLDELGDMDVLIEP